MCVQRKRSEWTPVLAQNGNGQPDLYTARDVEHGIFSNLVTEADWYRRETWTDEWWGKQMNNPIQSPWIMKILQKHFFLLKITNI